MREIAMYIRHTPIYLFQMGKVGSTSLKSTLVSQYGWPVFHAHNYNMLVPEAKQFLKWRTRLRLPIHVICPVREPISRNVSAFFQNFQRDTGLELSEWGGTIADLRDLFLKRYNHNLPLEWFDRNFRPVFDIDIMAQPFSVERKWQVYDRRSVRILVYRSDLDHAEQFAVVSRFIGREIDDYVIGNRSADKPYRGLYEEFCNTVKLPSSYISIMSRSSFSKRFWNRDEIEAFGEKWRS